MEFAGALSDVSKGFDSEQKVVCEDNKPTPIRNLERLFLYSHLCHA